MGLRFRRSIKLLPGVRLNAGLRDVSLSVGGRGATVNLSRRGVRTTLGLAGTGLSYSTAGARAAPRAAGAARSARSAEERALQVQLAEQMVATAERERVARTHVWRDMPELPTSADYAKACEPQPWPHPVPEAPNEALERSRFREACTKAAAERHGAASLGRRLLVPLALLVGGTVVAFAADAALLLVLSVVVSVVLAALGYGAVKSAAHEAREAERNGWPQHWAGLQAAYAAFRAWPEAERERAAFARRLLAGDEVAVGEAVADSLSDLDFPFETACQVALEGASGAYVLLDLPELEDVIAMRRQRALGNGQVREEARLQGERKQEYAQLATGLALWMARTAFAAAPSLETVALAAYTQRRQARTGELASEYVYEVRFSREEARGWSPASVDPVQVLLKARSRVDLRADGHLRRITPPEWEALAA